MRENISEISDIAGWLERQSLENGEISDSLKDSSEKQEQEMGRLEQMVQSAEGFNQQTKNVTKNSCTVAEGA